MTGSSVGFRILREALAAKICETSYAASRCDAEGKFPNTREDMKRSNFALHAFKCGARALYALPTRSGKAIKGLGRNVPCPRCAPEMELPRGFILLRVEEPSSSGGKTVITEASSAAASAVHGSPVLSAAPFRASCRGSVRVRSRRASGAAVRQVEAVGTRRTSPLKEPGKSRFARTHSLVGFAWRRIQHESCPADREVPFRADIVTSCDMATLRSEPQSVHSGHVVAERRRAWV